MNKLFIVLLAMCLFSVISAHAFVKRDDLTAQENALKKEQLTKLGTDIGNQIAEAVNPDALKKNDAVDVAIKALPKTIGLENKQVIVEQEPLKMALNGLSEEEARAERERRRRQRQAREEFRQKQLTIVITENAPILSSINCDTIGYIRDASVLTIAVVGANMTSSCAKDIARIVNRNHGKVVVYGVQGDSKEISELADELRKIGLYSCPGATLPRELQGLTYYNSHVAFLNTDTVKEEWYNHVVNSNYDVAVNMAKNIKTTDGEFMDEIVTRLISSAPRNVMSLAYKLWNGGAKDIVRNYFPSSFQHIFNEDPVTIVNKQYLQPLKLDVHTDSYNDRLAWGDDHMCQITSERVSWKLVPVWNRDGVTFKLYNTHRSMYLKLDVHVDNIGDRQAWGSTNSDEVRHRYYLEPLVKNGTLVFFIINCQYSQGLKLDVHTDRYGDRLVLGHNGSVHNEDERFWWIIAAW